MHEFRLIRVIGEYYSNDLTLLYNHFDNVVEALLSIFYNSDKINPYYKGERLYHINLLTQKLMLHSHAVKNLLLGYNLKLRTNPIPIPILDPFSVFVLKRAIIENFLTINYLSLSTNVEEAELRFKIWMMYGLSKRNCSDIKTEVAQNIQNLDLLSINSLKEEIIQSTFYKNLEIKYQNSFFKTLNNDWKIIFNNTKYYVLSWKKLLDYIGLKEEIKSDIYNFLSWHTHSQSLSTLQLAEMYDSGMDLINIKISTKELSTFVSFLINDLLLIDCDFENAYKGLSDYQHEIITFYNNAFREYDYIYDKIER